MFFSALLVDNLKPHRERPAARTTGVHKYMTLPFLHRQAGIIVVALVLIGIASWRLFRTLNPPPNSALILIGGKVYSSPSSEPLNDAVVVIRGERIVTIGPRSATSIPANSRIVDCTNMTIVAGFQNSHVHFAGPAWDNIGQIPSEILAKNLEQMLARYGFTTVIDLGSPLRDTILLRHRIDSGEVPGPRVLTAGQPLFPENGIPFSLLATLPPAKLSFLRRPGSTQEARQDVRENVAGGADFVKLFTGSSAYEDPAHLMRTEIAAAATAEAHREHKLVFAHPGNMAGFEIALSAHIDVFAHAAAVPKSSCPMYVQRMKEINAALIPTLNLYRFDALLPNFLNEVTEYSRKGGIILFGTDTGDQNQDDPIHEYLLMHTAGLSWPQILASLTTAPAQQLGESHFRGQVLSGMKADITVLGADPATDIGAFARVRYTIRNGIIIYQFKPTLP